MLQVTADLVSGGREEGISDCNTVLVKLSGKVTVHSKEPGKM